MSLIPFPDIPNVPGVPALPRLPGAQIISQSALGLVQGALWDAVQSDAQWGIFDSSGNSLTNPANISSLLTSVGIGATASTISVDYSKGTRVANFATEAGNFAQYNKVETPGEAKLVFAFTGTVEERNKFLNAIDLATKSTDLYSVITPEMTYLLYNVVDYGYSRRAEKGANLIVVELTLNEIRQVSAQYTSTTGTAVAPTNSDAAPQLNSGRVQPANPVQSVIHAVSSKITALASSLTS